MKRTCLLALVMLCLSPSYAAPTATRSEGRIVLANDLVRRTLVLEAGAWRTVAVSRADGADEVTTSSEEFMIRLPDGTRLTVADYEPAAEPGTDLANGRAHVWVRYRARPGLSDQAPRAVDVEYELGDTPYLRKRLFLHMARGQAVDRLEVERFAVLVPCDRGGMGEPVFIGDNWFAGLEYPAGYSEYAEGTVTIAHHPGLAKPAGEEALIQSKTAVIGTGTSGDPLELAFSDYVDTIRRPARNFVQYNSWYDLRGDELTLENLTSAFDAYDSNMLKPFGIKMDAFVPDDGWQDGKSIWMPRAHLYPGGFAPLRDALEARGSRLGIWMPLNGTNLDTAWGAGEGYEKSDRGGFYCLVGPKYNAAIREATRRIITQGNLAYYKHDFNTLRCTAEGHGHLPDDIHGHEANLDAELDLLAYERELQPDIFLNITSSVWLSPWWLEHADSVWMCAGDFGYDKTFPQLSHREWDMSYRDVHFYNVYHRQRRLVPVSAMMTHGIIHGKYCRLGGEQETLREWSDCSVLYYGRGVQLKELYVTPEMMDRERWDILGAATRWAIEESELMNQVVMVGGSPAAGEVHGYVHWLGDRGLIVLRNPDVRARGIELAFDKSVRYRGAPEREFRGRVVYPFVEDLPTRFVSGRPAAFEVPGCSVLVVELQPGAASAAEPLAVPALTGATASAELDEQRTGRIHLRVQVPDEDMQRCDLYLITRGAGKGLSFTSLTLNGEPATPRGSEGPAWALQSLDLRPLRGTEAVVEATLPGGGQEPFSSPDVSVSAWLVADRPVAERAAPDAERFLPVPISAGYRRQTTELLAETTLNRRLDRTLTAEDLASVRAAKLRVRVFDSNGEPQYRDKDILLNGARIANVPANRGTLAEWDEVIIDLPAEVVAGLKLRNTVQLTNAGGDCYKFGGLALAVQLADESWVETAADRSVHSSVDNWLYTEGELFSEGRSREIVLGFD